MTMAFPDTFLDELAARTDIVELISRYVTLKRRGGSMIGLCPFHSEKTPSFTVSPDKQAFHCFGCGEGGYAVQFAQKIENLDYVDAVRFLAERAGMRLPEYSDDPAERRLRERLYLLHTEAARFYHGNLMSGENPYALEYLTRRGVAARTIRVFGLGVCAPGVDSLVRAMTALGFTKEELIAGNLAVAGGRGDIVDRFKNRLMFPIISVQKKVIAFGGRLTGDGQPKYLNSSDTPIFAKGRQLFALNLAKSSKQKGLLLAEGYMDVIALHQAGFDNAVASLGTALTDKQAELIRKYSGGEVTITYDSDAAGRAASERAAALLNKADVKVSVLSLDGAKDPDDFLQLYGAAALRLRLEERESHMSHKLAQLAAEVDIQSDDGRVEFLKKAAAVLAGVNNEVEREIYTARAAAIADVTKEAVALEVGRLNAGTRRKAQFREQRDSARIGGRESKAMRAETEFIRLAIDDPELARTVAAELRPVDFETGFLGEAWARILSGTQSNLSMSQFFTEEQTRYMSKALVRPKSPEQIEKALGDCLDTIIQESAIRASDSPEITRAMLGAKKKKRYGEKE
ncbi:MAG: DNA primase [Oscillospiraceae bacterium]|nr:DNA primase [Oscillospiraceae bacterium]